MTIAAADDRLEALVRANSASLLRLALRHSLCPDDAHDACQRALEIYLERGDIREQTAAAWLRSVCKHEAMRIRQARQRVMPGEEFEFDEQPSPHGGDVHERALARERVAHVREALQACSSEETQALLLRAGGLSYREIGAVCGWSYSKVNRVLADGRARLHRRFNTIVSGRACAANRLTLNAIVAGEASVDDFVSLRPHLRHCSACRAELKALYAAAGCPTEDQSAKALAPFCRCMD
jgi:RNA polymerase sigma factor (sigma-70 family)